MAQQNFTRGMLDNMSDTPRSAVPTKRKKTETTHSSPRAKKLQKDVFSSADNSSIKQQTSQECEICAETKPVYRNFPKPPACSHKAAVCSTCFEKHFVTKIKENQEEGWSICSCPLCGERIKPEDAQAVLPRRVSAELITMIKNVSHYLSPKVILKAYSAH